MSNFINRNTLQYITSGHDPLYPSTDWIINPVLPNCASKYWKIVGDNVLERTTQEKADVDATAAAAQVAYLETLKDFNNTDKLTKAAFLVIFDQINTLRTKCSLATVTLQQFKDAVKSKYKGL